MRRSLVLLATRCACVRVCVYLCGLTHIRHDNNTSARQYVASRQRIALIVRQPPEPEPPPRPVRPLIPGRPGSQRRRARARARLPYRRALHRHSRWMNGSKRVPFFVVVRVRVCCVGLRFRWPRDAPERRRRIGTDRIGSDRNEPIGPIDRVDRTQWRAGHGRRV